ncbi:MAG: comEC [Acidimicrobiales bacterium]|nr:comEC [Acidimicrobiales bacterium]
MTDLGTVVMALAAAGGAWVASPVPLPIAAAVVVAALSLRVSLLLVVGVALLTSGLAVRSWNGLNPPRTGVFRGTVTLAGDPSSDGGQVRVEVRVAGKRVEAWAHGRGARLLEPRLAGERIFVAGRLQPVPAASRTRLAARHVAARMLVDEVGAWTSGDAASRVANGVRRTLGAGAESLSPSRRSLFLGFVLGDDRGQRPEVVDDFRSSGLAHLLVVSGENLAFVLALFAPLLRRLAISGRLVAAAAVLVFFGVLTRWEPSVLRAVAMVSVSMLAWALGRPASALRLLALAVTGLLVIDPLLVHSVGFLLSVGACTGIALLARPIGDALPGPRSLAGALGVTMAAQLGVAPVLVPIFGGVPVASLPANLLAVPAAGPVMMWGLAAGLPAGVAGGAVARAVCLPTGLLIGWIAGVARWSAAAPLGQLGAVHVALLAGVVAAGAVVRGRRGRLALLAAAAALLVHPALALASPPAAWGRPLAGARLWQGGGSTVVVVDRARADQLLRGVHGAGVRSIDLLVLTRPTRTTAAAADILLGRVPTRAVVAPAGTRLERRQPALARGEVVVGDLTVRIEGEGTGLQVRVTRRERTTFAACSSLSASAASMSPPGFS